MAARQNITFVITARDRTRAAFRAIGRGIRRLRLGLGSIVAAVGFGALTKQTLQFAKSLESASTRLKIPIRLLDGLTKSASEFGVTSEQLNNILGRIATRAGEAINGNDDLAEAWKKIGVSAADLESQDIAQILLKIARAAKAASDAGNDFGFQADLVKVLDTESKNLLGFLRQGPSEIVDTMTRLLEEGKLTNTIQEKILADRQRALEESLDRFNTVFQGILVKLLPFATSFGESVSDFTSRALPVFQNLGPTFTKFGETFSAAFDAFAVGAKELAPAMDKFVDIVRALLAEIASGKTGERIAETIIDAQKNAALIPEFIEEGFLKAGRELKAAFTPELSDTGQSVVNSLKEFNDFPSRLKEELEQGFSNAFSREQLQLTRQLVRNTENLNKGTVARLGR